MRPARMVLNVLFTWFINSSQSVPHGVQPIIVFTNFHCRLNQDGFYHDVMYFYCCSRANVSFKLCD